MANDDLEEEIKMIDAKLSKNKFLQGDEIGILDLALFGSTHQMGKEPKQECFKAIEDASPLFKEWHRAMVEKVGYFN